MKNNRLFWFSIIILLSVGLVISTVFAPVVQARDVEVKLFEEESAPVKEATPLRAVYSPAAYAAAGLSDDTKFNLKQVLDLPYTTKWFSVPPAAPQGQTPRLGTPHPSMVRAVQAAFRAATE